MSDPELTPIIGINGRPIHPESAQRTQRKARAAARAAGLPIPVFEGFSCIPVGYQNAAGEPTPAPPPPDTPVYPPHDARNSQGDIERVWWVRTVPAGYNWKEKTPARVLRRTERKAYIVSLLRVPNMPGLDTATPEAWQTSETWVKASSLTPRTADESHTARAAYPEF